MSSTEEPAPRNRRFGRQVSTKQWLSYVGDCRQLSDYLAKKSFKSAWFPLKYLDALLRAYGQVVFANNPVSGILIAVALSVANPEASLAGFLTATVGLLVSLALKQNPEAISSGATTFNALLIGLVTASTLPTMYGLQMDPVICLFMLAATVMSVYVTSAVSSILHTLGPYPVPYFTVPFNVTQLILFACIIHKTPYSDVAGGPRVNSSAVEHRQLPPGPEATLTAHLAERLDHVDTSKAAPEKFTEYFDDASWRTSHGRPHHGVTGGHLGTWTTEHPEKTPYEEPMGTNRNFTSSGRGDSGARLGVSDDARVGGNDSDSRNPYDGSYTGSTDDGLTLKSTLADEGSPNATYPSIEESTAGATSGVEGDEIFGELRLQGNGPLGRSQDEGHQSDGGVATSDSKDSSSADVTTPMDFREDAELLGRGRRSSEQETDSSAERANSTGTSPDQVDWGQVFAGTVLASSQVYGFCDAPAAATIYLAVMVFSPTMAAFCVAGSLFGTLAGLVLGSPPYLDVYSGEWGVQGLLSAAALGGFCYVITLQSAVAALVCALFATVIKHVLATSYAAANLPVMSMPFNLATILFLYVTSVSDEAFVQPQELTFPEKHWYDYRSARRSHNRQETDTQHAQTEGKEEISEEGRKLRYPGDDIA